MKLVSLRRYTLAIGLANSAALVHCRTTTPKVGPARVASVVTQLDQFIKQGMQKTGVPGVAVAVVYRDRVVYLRAFGVREAGKTAAVTPDTVFQLASLSKPIASTVVASLVGTRHVSWDSRIADIDKEFALSDPSITEQLTIRDLLSHRSGLDTASGDALEDLGFTRTEILHQMRFLPLPNRFRKDYRYSNFGFTEGAIAAAKAVDKRWEDVAEQRLFRPLGMKSSSFRYSDYENSANHACIHVIVDGKAVARYTRRPDAEAPAGAASSSIRDLAKWLRLQLAEGYFDRRSIVNSIALNETRTPQIQSRTDHSGPPQYYGLGLNISYDSARNAVFGHSGAFYLGTSTTVRFSPSQQIGIIVLTNAQPTGLAEATALTFFDLLEQDQPSQDWLPFLNRYFKQTVDASNNAVTDYAKLVRPTNPASGKVLSAYTGTYRNNYYGSIEISEQNGLLWMRFPGNGTLYSLMRWEGDLFTYRFEAEQGIGTRGVKFTLGGTPQVRIDNLALEGDGVFLKVSQ